MRHFLKFTPWILPLLGFVLGLAWAFITYNGVLLPWHFVGKPGEDVTRIVGFKDGRTLIIETGTGKFYSLGFVSNEKALLPPHLSWEEEQQDVVDLAPPKDWGPDFIALPPLFQVEQLSKLEYLYKVEGKGEVKFARTSDGNLWMWNHTASGLAGLVYYFYPMLGLLVGLAVALLLIGSMRFNRKRRLLQPIL